MQFGCLKYMNIAKLGNPKIKLKPKRTFYLFIYFTSFIEMFSLPHVYHMQKSQVLQEIKNLEWFPNFA